jgi:phosphoribosylglycinamide formyltransferase 1
MKKKISIVILTADEERHRFFKTKLNNINHLSLKLCISENKKKRQSFQTIKSNKNSFLSKHFLERDKIEKKFFRSFIRNHRKPKQEIIIERGELNYNLKLLKKVLRINPDFIISYGCSIIKGKFLEVFKKKMINIHLGISPYYRGSATNFWPFVKNQLQFLGVTFMMIDDGVDTGKIIHQFRPNLELGDNVHTVGNKMIRQMIEELNKILINFKKIQPKKQSFKKNICVFKKKDFNQKAIFELNKNMNANIIQKYLKKKNEIDKKFKIVKHSIL